MKNSEFPMRVEATTDLPDTGVNALTTELWETMWAGLSDGILWCEHAAFKGTEQNIVPRAGAFHDTVTV